MTDPSPTSGVRGGSSSAPHARRGRLGRDLLALARPGQWAKNILVVSIPLFDAPVWTTATVWRVAWAVAAFTLTSTLVYVVNDIVDRARDRAHPTKRERPIASGRVPVRGAIGMVVGQVVLLGGVLVLHPWLWWPLAAYLALTTAYSAVLKHLPLLDVFVVAGGFGLRLMLGYVAVGTEVSGWLLICVFSLCLLLIVGKRRQELVSTEGAHRPALQGYTVSLTEQLMMLSAVLAAGAYLLYVRTEAPLGTFALAAAVSTAPLALFGLFRYLQLTIVQGRGENPARLLLRDPALVGNALLWAALSGSFLLAAHLQLSP